ncbi:hypothetical protein U3A55_01060 [Salarchaeum sp. III]|uniref:hypothetical protein n=1 Tax=Salarchaeum sp. III TaxID=3107927 RepID=UPI002ED7808F
MDWSTVRAILLGPTPEKTKRWSVLAGVLLGGSLLYFAALNAFTGYSWPVHLALWWEGYAVLLGALVVVQAYATEALLVSWAVSFAAVFGLVMNYGGIALTGEPPALPELLGLGLVGGCLAALTIGTLGFAVGAALRRFAPAFR